MHSMLDLGYSGGLYGVYLFLGYLVNKRLYSNFSTGFIIVAGVILFLSTVAIQAVSYSNSVLYNVWYDFGCLILTGLCIFEIVSRLNIVCVKRYVAIVSEYAFAVFLVHILILRTVASAFTGIYLPLQVVLL